MDYNTEKDIFIKEVLQFIPRNTVQDFLLVPTKIIDLISHIPTNKMVDVTNNFILHSPIASRLQRPRQGDYLVRICFAFGRDGEDISTSQRLQRIFSQHFISHEENKHRREE
jgi:hypothetical protein